MKINAPQFCKFARDDSLGVFSKFDEAIFKHHSRRNLPTSQPSTSPISSTELAFIAVPSSPNQITVN
jgi:hypothetical protein